MDLEVTGDENESANEHELGSRSGFDNNNEDYWRSCKLSRTTNELNKTMSFHQGIPLLRSTSFVSSTDHHRQEQMLSFSSEKSDGFDFSKVSTFDYNNNKSSVSPYLQQISSSYCRNSGGGYGGGGGVMNTTTTNMHGNLRGVKGPFSLSQWAELEQQALIYKYITANVPVPSTLLLSLKKSFFPYGSLPPNSSFGWGSFHLGFSGGNMDPEPGRCRRTDGKKWRCSRDAVPDQKYCERHINRGRHRSRKPVEGQSGQNTLTTTAAVASSKVVTPVLSKTVQSSSDNNNSSLAAVGNHHLINTSSDSLANRVQNSRGPSTYQPATNFQQPKQTHPKQSNQNPFEFGLISSESLLNPSSKPYGSSSSHSYLDFTNQTKHSNSSWSEELKSDWTQLSMSIPITTTNTSPSSPKLALSPLRLSREFDPAIHMGLGVNSVNSEFLEPVKKVNNWIPISWGNSMGGPLGEVLKNATNSPKGVLQKSQAFGCLSNSSSGSSNVGSNNGENSKIGATLMNSSSGNNGLNG